ncbi:MAG: putative type II secretion system protein D precursor [Syntrophus sp. PtaB.Bin075]|nr:MAG: putative type II secretion system protein D precursor [Syntrophus sp. PtaB.Bin075]
MNYRREHRSTDAGNMARYLVVFLILCLTATAEGRSSLSRSGSAVALSSNTLPDAYAGNGNHGAGPPVNNMGSPGVTIDFDNVEIQTFIKAIGEMTGRNFLIDKQVQGSVTVFSPKQISSDEAYRVFQSVLEIHGYTTVPSGAVIKILPRKDAREKDIPTFLQDEEGGREDQLITRIVKLKHGNPEDLKKVIDPLVTRDSIVHAYPPSGMLVITDVESNVQRLLKIITALDSELEKNAIVMHVYPLQNASAEDLAKVLINLQPKETAPGSEKGQPALSRNVQIQSDKATNSLIITASAEDYALLQGLIQKLDSSRPMVYIEALILEVNIVKDFNLGTEWRAMHDAGSGGTGSLLFGSGGLGPPAGTYNILPDVTTPATYSSGFTFGILGTGITLGGITFQDIGAMIQAIKSDTDIHILSKPQLLTMDNEEAQIHVGKNVPYATRKETTTTNLDYSSYEYRDVGVSLKITPHINSEGFVRMKINQEVSQVTEDSPTGLPTTNKRAVNTTVTIKDSETVVIGGMIGDSTQLGTYKVPLLGDIPVLGWLFKSRSSNREKTNLYVFITPRVIRQHTDASRISKEKSDHLEMEKKNLSNPGQKKGNH